MSRRFAGRESTAILMLAFLGTALQSTSAADPDRQAELVSKTIGVELVLIPAGAFSMGNDETVADLLKEFTYARREWFDNAKPHAVRITKPFYLGKYEVTRGEFKRFVKDSGYVTQAEKDNHGGWGYDPTDKKFKQSREFSWQNTGWTQTDLHPVLNVTWNDAKAFCDWLSRKENKTYRLPTEAEWEHACRAGTTTRFAHGNDPEGLTLVGNVADGSYSEKFKLANAVSSKDGFVFTAPVGKFQPNKFGLYDMHGNVWEWCADGYEKDYYDRSPPEDPPGSLTGTDRVRRGGGWSSVAFRSRSAFRNRDAPDYRSFDVGFRLALGSVR